MSNEHMTEGRIIERIQGIFSSEKGYSIEHEPHYYIAKQHSYVPDLLIYKNSKPIASVEIKLQVEEGMLYILQTRMQIAATVFETRFIIVTDGEKTFIIDITKGKNRWDSIELDELLHYVESAVNGPKKLFGPFAKENEFRDAIKIVLKSADLSSFESIKDILEKKPEDAVSFNDANGFDFSDTFKKAIQNSLESPKNGNELCRYTSLSSLFRQINNNQHSMASLEGMNDSSEINYVDSILFGDATIKAKAINQGDRNNFFILSFCGKEQIDDLTLWRLYGDDAKGVCLVYESFSTDLPDGFIMKNVVYDNKLLSILKNLVECIQSHGYNYIARDDTWKHFFKPKDYETEKEVRLLLNKKRTKTTFSEVWIHNMTYNIIHPIVLFDSLSASENFPMQMKKIILGPNMPEAELNQRQIMQWLKSKDLQIEVEISKIGNYRTS